MAQNGLHSRRLPHKTEGHHSEHETQAHSDAVPERRGNGILAGKRLDLHGDNGERNDEFYENPHLLVGRWHIGSQITRSITVTPVAMVDV